MKRLNNSDAKKEYTFMNTRTIKNKEYLIV